MIGRSQTYRVLASIGAVVLITIGITIGFAAVSFSAAHPTEIFSWARTAPLSAILVMISTGMLLILSGLVIGLDATLGYHFV